MILVADSGSTKTAWRLIKSSGTVSEIETTGLNPLFNSKDIFSEIIANMNDAQWELDKVNQVYFYGAGITDDSQKSKVNEWLQSAFKNAKISTESDLLGAARGAFSTTPGVVGILGTGSNSGYYDGESITKHISPLGYVLGDEGSGNALGKRLIKMYLRNELPDNLSEELRSFYPDNGELLKNIYRSDQPAKLLASFVPFIHLKKENSVIDNLIRSEFEQYLNIIKDYNNHARFALIGSVAFHFQTILREVVENCGLSLTKIIKSPIDDLVLYHQAKIL